MRWLVCALLAGVGLPVSYDGADWSDLLSTMSVDKKARGATLRFVVLNGLADPAVFSGPTPALLEEAYLAVTGGARSF